MQVSENNKTSAISFKGMKKDKDSSGLESYKFFLPYDSKKYKASVEIVPIKHVAGHWAPVEGADEDPTVIEMKDKFAEFSPVEHFFDKKEHFAYRFKLEDKESGKVSHHFDNGILTNPGKGNGYDQQFTVVLRNRGYHNKPGQMYHLLPDNFNPGYKINANGKIIDDKETREKAMEATRTHFNQMGGNIAGIIKKIPELKEMGVGRVLSTPIFGQDEISSHGYWTTNPYQVSSQNGSEKDFKKMQVELFKNDMSLVADGAFVNEGFEGIHMKHIMKWGDKSPYLNWFTATGIHSDSLKMSVIPNAEKDAEVFKHIKLRVVNSPKQFSTDKVQVPNNKYDRKKATYVQLYDDRLVSDELLAKNEIIRKYDKLNPEKNIYEIASHNDSVLPYAFEVSADQLDKFSSNVKDFAKSKDGMDFVESVLHFDEFDIAKKQPGGADTWDGNADIFKMNYFQSKQDVADLKAAKRTNEQIKDFKVGGYQVQRYIQNVGSFWTRETKNALIEHTINQIKIAKEDNPEAYAKAIDLAVEKKELPSSAKDAMNKDVLSAIINGEESGYQFKEYNNSSGTKEIILSEIMKYPLEAVELGPDVSAVLGSPYISMSTFSEKDMNKERVELFNANHKKSDEENSQKATYKDIPLKYRETYKYVDENVYADKMYKFASGVINFMKEEGDISIGDDSNERSNLSKYIIPLIASEMTKFAVAKALAPDAVEFNSKGEPSYDLKKMRNTTLHQVGVAASSPKQEATRVAEKLAKGISKISEQDKKTLAKYFAKKFKDVNVSDVKVATALVDRTEAGLNWRIDATKDVANIGHIENKRENFEDEWPKAIKFWKGFANQVRKENKNSYMIAEMTDLDIITKMTKDSSKAKYKEQFRPEREFIERTGMTTTSNYSYLYSYLPGIVGPSTDKGKHSDNSLKEFKTKNLLGISGDWAGNMGFLYGNHKDAIIHSHNFFENHDKPRLVHSLALDMELFHAEQKEDDKKSEYSKTYNNYVKAYAPQMQEAGRSDEVSPKALAMTKALSAGMGKAIDKVDGVNKEAAKKAIMASLRDFTQGDYLKNSSADKPAGYKAINPETYATRPLDKVIPDVIKNAYKNHNLTGALGPNKKELLEEIENKSLQETLEPALEKYRTLLKAMIVMPGDSTIYAGSELGETGYETPNKNVYVQNRNTLHWNWLNEPGKEFIAKHNTEVKKITNLRNIEENPKLSALSNGDTVVLDANGNDKFLAMYRYDDKSDVICLLNLDSGNARGVDKNHKPAVARINLDRKGPKIGIEGGLEVGSMFKDATKNEDVVYGVCIEKGQHTIRGFKNKDNYKNYVQAYKENKLGSYILGNDNAIVMDDNLLVLERVSDKPFGKTFKGGVDLKVQAYLGQHNLAQRQPAIV